MHYLTTGIHSEKCVVMWCYHCANIIKLSYTNTDGIAYYTHRLYGTDYCSQATNLYSLLLYKNNEINQAQEKVMPSRHSVNLRCTELLPV